MKKILALAFALILCLGAFVACGMKPDKIVENLKDAGYEAIDVAENADDLADDVSRMEEQYKIKLEGKLLKIVYAEKDAEFLSVYIFEKKSDAKLFFEALDEQYDEELVEYEKTIAKMEEQAEEADKDVTEYEGYEELCFRVENLKWGRDGKVVYIGSKSAIRAAK